MTSAQEAIFAEIQDFVESEAEGRDVQGRIPRIEQLVLSNDEAEELYVKYVFATVSLIRTSQTAGGQQIDGLNLDVEETETPEYDALRHSDAMILPGIRESGLAQDEPVMIPAAPRSHRAGASPLWRNVRWVALAATVLLAIGVTAVVLYRPAPVATLTQVAQATWEDGSSIQTPAQLRPGERLSLATGYCSLHFADGTHVIVEGRAHFTVQSRNQILLGDGKLTVAMTGGAKGFVVQTPASIIADMGTEFGVSVDPSSGDTQVDVFKGSVRVTPSAQELAARSVDLVAGDMATVNRYALRVQHNGSIPQKFVRDISGGRLSLNVADLIAGGDGTTQHRNGRIDPSDGSTKGDPTKEITTDSQYHRVPTLPVIDGCFIPNRAGGLVQLDSAGDRCALPATDGQTYDLIFSGNSIPVPRGTPYIATILNGVNYSQPDHWLLYLHANVGLTFDLNALRRLHPGSTLRQFHAVVGNVFTYDPSPQRATILYIVDGKITFQRTFDRSGVFTATVSLSDSDHFLSIVTLEAAPPRNGGKDVMLGDPAFEMGATR